MASLEVWGRELVSWLATVNVWTGAILVCVLVADRLLASRVRPAWRALLYGAVLLRLVVPLDWTRLTGLAADPVLSTVGLSSLEGELPAAEAAAAPAAFPFSWGAAFSIGYVLTALLLLGWRLRGQRRLRRMALEARPVGSLSTGRGKPVTFLQHGEWGPGVVGILRPRIVVPRSLVEAGGDRLRWVLRHEMAHIRRADPFVLPLLQLITLLFWAVIPVWIALLRYRRTIEMACDDMALHGAPGAQRREYGELLMALADAGGVSRWMEVTMHHDLTSRIRELRHVSRWRRGLQWAAPALLVVALILFVGPGTLGNPALAESTAEDAKDAPESAKKLVCPTPDAGVPGCVQALENYDKKIEEIWDVTTRAGDELQVRGRTTKDPTAVANLLSEMKSCAVFSDFELVRYAADDSGAFEFVMSGHCREPARD